MAHPGRRSGTGPSLAIVAAVAENGVIGRGNALAWRLRGDLRRFRDLTWGKPLLMGRRTFESIGKPLPGRETIVLTRSPDVRPDGVLTASGWDEARSLAAEAADRLGAAEVAVVGGAEIYRLALPDVERLYLTRVHAAPEGDAFFPPIDLSAFVETSSEHRPAGPEDDHATTFTVHERRRPGAAP